MMAPVFSFPEQDMMMLGNAQMGGDPRLQAPSMLNGNIVGLKSKGRGPAGFSSKSTKKFFSTNSSNNKQGRIGTRSSLALS